MNKPIRAKISALGTYVPPRLLTNADLEKMVDTTDDWIMTRVGIRERHIVDKGVATSDLAVEAARKTLAWCSTNWGQRGRGDSIFPGPARLLFIPCRRGRSSSLRVHTSACW